MRYFLPFLIPCISYAADIPEISADPRYQIAINKMVQATAIQSGVKAKIDRLENAALNNANAIIGEYAPYRATDVLTVMGVTYAFAVRREVIKSFHNPLLPYVTNDIYLSMNTVSLKWRILF